MDDKTIPSLVLPGEEAPQQAAAAVQEAPVAQEAPAAQEEHAAEEASVQTEQTEEMPAEPSPDDTLADLGDISLDDLLNDIRNM